TSNLRVRGVVAPARGILIVDEAGVVAPTHVGARLQRFLAPHHIDPAGPLHPEATRAVGVGAGLGTSGGAIIMPGDSLGSGGVTGAGSVVSRDIPDNVFAAGNPCRVVREIRE